MDEEIVNSSDTSPQNSIPDDELQNEVISCKACGNSLVEEGYELPLCENCREALSKKPVPIFIKAFAAVIAIIFIFSITKLLSSIQAGVHYEKAINAERQKKYSTAAKEYEKVIKKYPICTRALAKLVIAYYYTDNIDKLRTTFRKIAGEDIDRNMDVFYDLTGSDLDGDELVKKVNFVIDNTHKFNSPEIALVDILKKYSNASPKEKVIAIKPYLSKHPSDPLASYFLADSLYDMKNFIEAEKCLVSTTSRNPEFNQGYELLAATLREEKKYDEAVSKCKAMLKRNSEFAEAYVSWSKIELKRHNDKKALKLAIKGYNLDKSDSHTVSNLALAYHYNGMYKNRDKIYKLFKTYSNIDFDDKMLTSVFSGKQKWRE